MFRKKQLNKCSRLNSDVAITKAMSGKVPTGCDEVNLQVKCTHYNLIRRYSTYYELESMEHIFN